MKAMWKCIDCLISSPNSFQDLLYSLLLSCCLANVVNKWFSGIWGNGKLYSISGVNINSLRLSSTIKYLCFLGTRLSSLLKLIISQVFTPLMFCGLFFIHGFSNNFLVWTSGSLQSTPLLIFIQTSSKVMVQTCLL